MKLDSIVPWGRSLAEYQNMFSLSDVPLGSLILSCGDGPSSFNADATRQGYKVTSYDPIYNFSSEMISDRIESVRHEVMDQIRANQSNYVWKNIASPDELEKIRMDSMSAFLRDFDAGKSDGRYIAGSAPRIPFGVDTFDLALSSHFLFLYSNQFGFADHLETIKELMRVSKEVRIFPLQAIHDNKRSEHLIGIIEAMKGLGFTPTIEAVSYEFQRDANEMLKIVR